MIIQYKHVNERRTYFGWVLCLQTEPDVWLLLVQFQCFPLETAFFKFPSLPFLKTQETESYPVFSFQNSVGSKMKHYNKIFDTPVQVVLVPNTWALK